MHKLPAKCPTADQFSATLPQLGVESIPLRLLVNTFPAVYKGHIPVQSEGEIEPAQDYREFRKGTQPSSYDHNKRVNFDGSRAFQKAIRHTTRMSGSSEQDEQQKHSDDLSSLYL